MVRDLSALTVDTSLREAARMFSMMRVSGLPVVDEEQHIIGFLSESDIIQTIVPRSRDTSGIFLTDFGQVVRKMEQAGELLVGDYMTGTPLTVKEDADLMTVTETMLSEGFKVLPVVRDDILIGTVNRAHVCAALMEDRGES